MDLTRAAIEKNRITAVALLLVLAGGLSAYRGMSRAEDPGFTVRVAQVVTRFPGASPERVERLITDPIEEAIQELPEIDYLSSTSKTGVSIVMVNVRDEFDDLQPIWSDLRRKVERAARRLPEGVIGPQVNDEFGDVFGIVVTVTGDGYSYAELKQVADEVRDELLRVPRRRQGRHLRGAGRADLRRLRQRAARRAGPLADAAPLHPRQREHHHPRRQHPHRGSSASRWSRPATSSRSTTCGARW